MQTYSHQNNAKKKWIAVIFLLTVNLIVSIFIVLYIFILSGGDAGTTGGTLAFESAQNGVYILYIGTNDKDTYAPIASTEEAVETVNGICAKYAEGWTMCHAEGGWVDDKGLLTQESTLMYTFAYIGEEAIISIMDETLAALNQNSILIERRDISSAFYYGEK